MATRISNKYLALVCVCALLIGGSASLIWAPITHADLVAQTIPFAQNWSNTGLITADDNWNSVPGIIGYRGDGLTSSTGTDPQTILADGSAEVDVNANRSDPDTFLSGGVTEYDGIPNPVVALNGSGTADAPHLVINLTTSGTTAINVAYNLRDLDASADNSVQRFALQYRVGNTGNYTNLSAGFVADATTGPSQATLVTPVSVALPAACENQPLVQLRIMTTNADGNDEWVGIDDINVTGTTGGTINLSGVGMATPPTVGPGQTSLLKVTVTPANTPPSTGIAVAADLSTIGLSATQMFFDNGTNGDVTPGDNVFSYLVTVPLGTSNGQRNFLATITDAQMRSANTTIALGIQAPRDPAVHLTMGNPSNAATDVANPTNYLMLKPQYVLSYHRDRGTANWVSWHLDSSWLGTTPRQDDFRNDTTLPAGWYQVQNNDYSGSGFDRGHHTPSADRTFSVPENSSTFLMTNMMPQAPDNNSGPWGDLESYCRTLVAQGNELYIIAGGAGVGGSGDNGGTTNTIAAGRVTVPSVTWKVIIVLPVGDNDVDRVYKTTRVIAVIMPNTNAIGTTPWRNFRTSVDRVEGLTGFNFFSNVRPQIENLIERKIDQQ
jgi:endonuclease G